MRGFACFAYILEEGSPYEAAFYRSRLGDVGQALRRESQSPCVGENTRRSCWTRATLIEIPSRLAHRRDLGAAKTRSLRMTTGEQKSTERPITPRCSRRSAGTIRCASTTQFTEDERMIRDTARAYAQDNSPPRVIDAYMEEKTDRAIFAEMGALGLLGVTVPQAYGGAGADYVPMAWSRAKSSGSIPVSAR